MPACGEPEVRPKFDRAFRPFGSRKLESELLRRTGHLGLTRSALRHWRRRTAAWAEVELLKRTGHLKLAHSALRCWRQRARAWAEVRLLGRTGHLGLARSALRHWRRRAAAWAHTASVWAYHAGLFTADISHLVNPVFTADISYQPSHVSALHAGLFTADVSHQPSYVGLGLGSTPNLGFTRSSFTAGVSHQPSKISALQAGVFTAGVSHQPSHISALHAGLFSAGVSHQPSIMSALHANTFTAGISHLPTRPLLERHRAAQTRRNQTRRCLAQWRRVRQRDVRWAAGTLRLESRVARSLSFAALRCWCVGLIYIYVDLYRVHVSR